MAPSKSRYPKAWWTRWDHLERSLALIRATERGAKRRSSEPPPPCQVPAVEAVIEMVAVVVPHVEL